MLPEPRLARQIIETLGQSGTPLSKGVSFYNVGNESLLNAIEPALDLSVRAVSEVNDKGTLQFYNRTGNNGHYWTNWPSTTTDTYMNGTQMHTVFPYTMLQLQATGAE